MFGFCTADFWSSFAYESAEQKPKHCLTPGFLIPHLQLRRPVQHPPLPQVALLHHRLVLGRDLLVHLGPDSMGLINFCPSFGPKIGELAI